MPNDLDRAWIINGDDLRIALEGDGARPPLVPNPRDVAAWLLECIGKPLDGRPGVTVSQLATALEGFYVDVWHHGESVHAEITNADETAEALRATLSRMAALRGDEPSRWPMPRGVLATRLSKALDGKDILVDRDPAPGGERYYVQAMDPAGLAAELVNDIDAQGTEDAGCACTPGERCEWHQQHAAPLPAPEPCTCPVPTEKCLRGCTGEPARTVPDDGVPADVTAAANIIRELDALSGTSGAGWDHAINVLRFAAGHFGYLLLPDDE